MRKEAKKVLEKHCPEATKTYIGDDMEQLQRRNRLNSIIDAMIEFRSLRVIKNNKSI